MPALPAFSHGRCESRCNSAVSVFIRVLNTRVRTLVQWHAHRSTHHWYAPADKYVPWYNGIRTYAPVRTCGRYGDQPEFPPLTERELLLRHSVRLFYLQHAPQKLADGSVIPAQVARFYADSMHVLFDKLQALYGAFPQVPPPPALGVGDGDDVYARITITGRSATTSSSAFSSSSSPSSDQPGGATQTGVPAAAAATAATAAASEAAVHPSSQSATTPENDGDDGRRLAGYYTVEAAFDATVRSATPVVVVVATTSDEYVFVATHAVHPRGG